AALVLVTVACGGYQFPGGSQSPNPGTVTGRVLALPCAPVEKAGETCAGRPVASLELDDVAGSSVTKAVTDATGNYAVELAPATWTTSTTLGSAAAAASKAGHAASASSPCSPTRSHISSLMCGASGFNNLTSV